MSLYCSKRDFLKYTGSLQITTIQFRSILTLWKDIHSHNPVWRPKCDHPESVVFLLLLSPLFDIPSVFASFLMMSSTRTPHLTVSVQGSQRTELRLISFLHVSLRIRSSPSSNSDPSGVFEIHFIYTKIL